MTSQLTPEHSTRLSQKKDETRERMYLQPWFVLAVLCVIAGVLMVVFS